MELLEIKEHFQVQDESLTFQELVDEAPKIADSIKNKNVIILPSHGSTDAFYSGSLDTLDYLNENNVNTDIYSSDDDYKELGLHSADIWLGTFFIKNIIIPVFCGVIASYIYEKIKAKAGDRISLKFIVEKKDGKSASVSFGGKVEELHKALDAVKEFSDEG